MSAHYIGSIATLAFATLAFARPLSAQSLGTFRWQLQPYCNVVTVAVTQIGSQYRFEGFDDQCGAPARATVTGLGVPNPDGTLEFGWTIVTAAGPQHIDVTFNIGSLGGPWHDNGGNSGTLVFNPGSPSGPPRPGGLGAVAINPGQVQRRISGSCGAGQFVQGVNQDGSVACAGDTAGNGDVTGIYLFAGLNGGGSSGEIGLGVDFGGSGSSLKVARSDHDHGVGISNVAVGPAALLSNTQVLGRNTAVGAGALAGSSTGTNNTALGWRGLLANTTGSYSVGIGAEALIEQTTGVSNVAVGYRSAASITAAGFNTAIGDAALALNTIGNRNVAVGASALALTTAHSNTAVGVDALNKVTSGATNIAIGRQAGDLLTTGSNNIYLGAPAAAAAENTTTRLGAATQTRAFIGGIRAITTGVANAVPVVIDGNGQLGTVSSSRRFKEDIADLGPISLKVQQLRPVQFRYTQAFADGGKPMQYGLIAEEVNEVLPELAVRGADGQIETVAYQVLPTLLLAEVQRLERERAVQDARIASLERDLAAFLKEVRGQK